MPVCCLLGLVILSRSDPMLQLLLGPRVGGINTCGANRPVLKATVKALPLTFAFLDMLLVAEKEE